MGFLHKLFPKKQDSKTMSSPVKPEPIATMPSFSPSLQIPCDSCNGYYKLRDGKYGIFAGCSHYPACRSTLSLPNYVLKYLQTYGLNIYCWEKECYRCGKKTPVYSYYLDYDLAGLDELFSLAGPTVGLGDLSYIDELLSTKIPTIQMRYSKTTHTKYMANTCKHCGALQGRNYVVEDPHEIIGELWHDRDMEKFLYLHLDLTDTTPLTKEIQRLYAQVDEG